MDINERLIIEADIIRTHIGKYLKGTLSEAEQTYLYNWVNASVENKEFFEKITSETFLESSLESYKQDRKYVEQAAVQSDSNNKSLNSSPQKERRSSGEVKSLKKLIAAASVVFIVVSYLMYSSDSNIKDVRNEVGDIGNVMPIVPGKTGAILTLADGSEIVLDSINDKTITRQNGLKIEIKDGVVYYVPTADSTIAITWNTIRTPKGRQFQVVLPDNTIVWLNASSSIRYPTAFNGTNRRVEVEGEVYMEVAQNAQQPFFVKIGDQAMVEVLGTAFNINAYPDEKAITTTLLSGAVKMVQLEDNAAQPADGNAYLILKPAQQGILTTSLAGNSINKNSALRLKKQVDIDRIIAWKNGLFDFQDANIQEVMTQLARWYNLEVKYESGVPNIEFYGKMDRGLTWEQVQRFLAASKVNFRMEQNNTVIISP